MRACSLPTFLLALASTAIAQTTPAPQAEDEDALIAAGKKKLPGLKLELIAPKTRYELGEPIELTMRYTYSGERRLHVQVITYDRSGRITDFWFTAEDEKGNPARDPIKGWTGGFGGGLRGGEVLGPAKPYEQKATTSEWLCFDEPGRYRVTAHSRIVSLDDYGTGFCGPSISLASEPVEIEIVPFDEERRRECIAGIETRLKGQDQELREKAMRQLRFMLDERTIPLMVKGLEDEFGNVASQAWFGLVSFRDAAPLKAALLKRVNDEARVITPGKIWTYAELLTHAELLAEGKTKGRFTEGHGEAFSRWKQLLADKFRQKLDRLPPAEAFRATLEGLSSRMLSHSEPAHWRRIMSKVGAAPEREREHAAILIENYCRLPELVPDLKAVAADTGLPASFRSAAVVALHEMQDDSLRDLVADDLVLPNPNLKRSAHATLGDYRAQEIGEALLQLLGPSKSAAVRLRDFGGALSAEELREVMQRRSTVNPVAQGPVLEALAIRSPDDAVPFICDIVRNPILVNNGLRGDAIRLLSRIDSPQAQELVLEVFRSPYQDDRRSMAFSQQNSWVQGKRLEQYGPEKRSFGHFRRNMPPNADVAGAFVPELIALFKADPSGEVRQAAMGALSRITGIPSEGLWHATKAQADACVPKWQAWWLENGARYGRWGKVRRGIALKCWTDKGEYEIGEEIRVNVRTRHVSEGEDQMPTVRLYSRLYEPDEPFEMPGETFQRDIDEYRVRALGGGPPPVGADSVSHYDLLGYMGHAELSRPCSVRFRAQYFFKNETKLWGKDAVESHPVTIRIRKAPDDIAWSEPRDGLALGVSLAKRAFTADESVPVEVRFKNTRENGSLVIPSPRQGMISPAFMGFSLRDSRARLLDMESNRQSISDEAAREYREEYRDLVVRIGPGRTHRGSAYLGSSGRRLYWHPDGGLTHLEGGGEAVVAVTYEVPADFGAVGRRREDVWHGTLTAELGRILIEKHEDKGLE